MTLRVFTARIGTRDPDALDVTAKSAKGDARVWAPSWTIVNAGVFLRDHARRLFDRDDSPAVWDAAWTLYVVAYTGEMRESYARNRAAWERLLARERAVLTCFCTDSARCHRTVLAGAILPKLGAVYEGEVGG